MACRGIAMLKALFTFRGRINRLHYLAAIVALGFTLGVAIIAAVMAMMPHFIAARKAGVPGPVGAVILTAMLVLIPFLWISLSLQACRFRDIGWNPVYVIPAWIVMGVVDHVAAMSAPGLAVGRLHQNTWIGLLANLALAGCLLLWPGRTGGDGDLHSRLAGGGRSEPPESEPTSAAKTSRPWSPKAAAAGGFGQRGV